MRLALISALWTTIKIASRYSHIHFSLIDQMMISGANFTTGILLARHLGVNQFGQFSLIWLVVQFVQTVQNGAIFLPMMSIGPKQSTDTYKFYYTIVFVHELIFAILSTAFVIGGILIWDEIFKGWNVRELLWPFSAVVFATQIQDFLRRYFFSLSKSKISTVIDSIRYGGQILAFIWLFMFSSWQPDIAGVLWTMFAAAGVSIMAAWCKVHNLEWSLAQWQIVSLRHWHFSKWLISTTLLGWISGELYYVIVGGVLGSSAVGILKSAQTIMGASNVFFQGMQNFMPVRASEVFREGEIVQLTKFVRKSTFFITLATGSIAIVVCAYPNHVMEFFYGPQFRDYGWVLVGYAIIYMITALGVVLPVGLLTLEKTFPTLLGFITSGIVSAVIMYPLVRVYGLTGALIGLAIFPAVQSLVQFIAFQKLVAREVFPRR